jgi:hypothetical protein
LIFLMKVVNQRVFIRDLQKLIWIQFNFDWICTKNLFDESSEPKSVHKGSSKTHLDTIQFIT